MIEIYCDNSQEGLWFKDLSDHFNESKVKTIKVKGTNPSYIERFLRYDRPDIILVIDEEPKLVIEKTSEVPTGHNVGQRFARIANTVEEGIMFVKFFPFKARKHGRYTSICYVNARLFAAFEKMMELHKIPVLAINWPCDRNGELVRDGSEDNKIRLLINELVNFNFVPKLCPNIEQIKVEMKKEYNNRIKMHPAYKHPPPTVQIVETGNYVNLLTQKFPDEIKKLPQAFFNRKETLVYKFSMTEEHCRREDPYTGTQFIYDYIWCRNGVEPTDKYRNLVLVSPLIRKSVWLRANPNNPNRKSWLYYTISNLIVLKDGLIKVND